MKQLFLVLLIFGITAHAQEERYSLRVYAGYSLSQFAFYTKAEDFRSTFNAGIEIRKKVDPAGIYLQSGIRWNGYGWTDNTAYYSWISHGYDSVIVSTTDVYCATIPLIATYKFKKGLPGLTISAGPQFSINMLYRSKRNGEVNVSFWSLHYPDLGAYFSLGYERQLGERWILGGEAYTNLLVLGELYNFGVGVSGRYMLNRNAGNNSQ